MSQQAYRVDGTLDGGGHWTVVLGQPYFGGVPASIPLIDAQAQQAQGQSARSPRFE